MQQAPPELETLPAGFVARLQQIVPTAAWPACCAGFAPRTDFSVRINTLRSSPWEVRQRLIDDQIPFTDVAWLEQALLIPIDHRDALVRSELVANGQIYVQNLSSMLAVSVLDPQPGEQILDLAAAPGGKSTDIAARMRNEGWLSVVEPIRGRYFRLQENLRRCGVGIAHSYQVDGRTVGHKVSCRFDRVLLDAPCSGEARFRFADPRSYHFWSPRKIREQSRKQRGLLKSALRATRPGGRVLYCTCSFAPEENELVVSHLLRRHPDLARVLPFSVPIPNWQPGLAQWQDRACDPQLADAIRILPRDSMDGLFLCLLERL